jgi:tagatose 6-phosphate kinase
MTVVTVTLNAAVDKTYIVPDFTLDRIHRPVEARTSAGGKGINVARVYRTLGGDVIATGFLGGTNGDFIAAKLTEEQIPADFVRVAEESRVAIAVLDPKARTQTEVNEIGPQVTPQEVEALVEKVRSLLGSARWLVLSGSIPPGVPTDIYARLIRLARESDVRTVLDTSGEPLKAAIAERPFLAKPNRHELAALGVALADWADAPKAAQELRSRYNLDLALVTGGANGAVLASPAGIFAAKPPSTNAVSAVGSGDSLTAALIWAMDREPENYAEALQWGVAAGAANTLTPSPGHCSKEQIEELCGKIKTEKIRLEPGANKRA